MQRRQNVLKGIKIQGSKQQSQLIAGLSVSVQIYSHWEIPFPHEVVHNSQIVQVEQLCAIHTTSPSNVGLLCSAEFTEAYSQCEQGAALVSTQTQAGRQITQLRTISGDRAGAVVAGFPRAPGVFIKIHKDRFRH